MHKKHHEKFKILGILAVTTQAREGIETLHSSVARETPSVVTTQAREGIETCFIPFFPSFQFVTTQAREGIETTIGACNYLATHVTTQAREGIETVEDILAEDWLFA